MNLSKFLNVMNGGALIAGGSETHLFMHQVSQEAMILTSKLNNTYHEPEEVRLLFSQLIGKEVHPSFGLFPPFYTDCGKNISIGKEVFINSGCRFQDQGGIIIGSGTLIGHNVVIATLNHGEDPVRRSDMLPAPVRIGDRVWIGANATILSGVTIGEGAIVAAGAVVNKDVAPFTVVGGVPARFLKKVEGGRENE